ncbi:MAG: alternative ribosome rescue aminoacyl-tRNA hydrolase ArfB [Chloroflexota bacterium]
MLQITKKVVIPLEEIEFEYIRAQGAGGQHVNKSSTAVHMRFDIQASSLPTVYKERLLQLSDHRITKEGVVVIKSQQHRSQEQNREAALNRLQQLVQSVTVTQKARRPTKPSKGAKQRRIDEKKRRGNVKETRKRVSY